MLLDCVPVYSHCLRLDKKKEQQWKILIFTNFRSEYWKISRGYLFSKWYQFGTSHKKSYNAYMQDQYFENLKNYIWYLYTFFWLNELYLTPLCLFLIKFVLILYRLNRTWKAYAQVLLRYIILMRAKYYLFIFRLSSFHIDLSRGKRQPLFCFILLKQG